jgi:hypothetical protein
VTRMSESKARSVAAIGNSRVIPAQAGIQCLTTNDAGFPRSRERRHREAQREARDPS